MSAQVFAVLAAGVWIAVGVLAAFVLLGRQGYRDPRWYLIGAVLGPLFIPVAAERADRSVAVIETVGEAGERSSSASTAPPARTARCTWPRGCSTRPGPASSSSRCSNPTRPTARTTSNRPRVRAVLAERATWFGTDAADRVSTEVVCGQPARAIETEAEMRGAAVIVLGRHGAGRTLHLLGNVAHQVSRHAAVPVLLAEPPEPPHRHAGAVHGRHRAHIDGEQGDTHPATGSPRRT